MTGNEPRYEPTAKSIAKGKSSTSWHFESSSRLMTSVFWAELHGYPVETNIVDTVVGLSVVVVGLAVVLVGMAVVVLGLAVVLLGLAVVVVGLPVVVAGLDVVVFGCSGHSSIAGVGGPRIKSQFLLDDERISQFFSSELKVKYSHPL